MNTKTTSNPLSDLDWDAFRYVSGEMTSEEQSAFERRMEAGPDVALAVSRALTLEQVTESQFRSETELTVVREADASRVTADSRAARLSRSMTIAASLGACLLAAYMLVPVQDDQSGRDTGGVAVVDASEPGTTELIEGWLQAAVSLEPEPLDRSGEMIEIAMVEPADLYAEDDVVPDWMYAAFDPIDDGDVE